MYGYQLFPTNPKNLNLLQLKKYEKIFNRLIGYQDHSPPDLSGFTVPAAALGAGRQADGATAACPTRVGGGAPRGQTVPVVGEPP